MPIYEVSGDVMLTSAQTIAHGVAPGENYPTGIALAVRERWPEAVKDFKSVCRRQRLQPGDIHLWKGPEKWVLNLLTQDEAYTKDVRITRAHRKYLHSSLTATRRDLATLGIESIALPRVCAGLGKMDWEEVLPIIREEWDKLPVPVFLYTRFVPELRAPEETMILKPTYRF